MRLGLDGKHAVVTAATRGLGRAVAHGLCDEGCNVTICGRDPAALDDVVRLLDASHGGCLAVPTDLRRATDIETLFAEARRRFGPVDILFVNGGGPPLGEFLDFPDEVWSEGFESLVLAAVRLVRHAVPEMVDRGFGRILFSTSISVHEPQPFHILSTSLRASISGIAKTLARDLARHGVTVNVLVPDRIMTDRTRANAEYAAQRAGISLEDELERRAAAIPTGRYGEPHEYANAAVFLASEAAGYLTGLNLRVDGGRHSGLL